MRQLLAALAVAAAILASGGAVPVHAVAQAGAGGADATGWTAASAVRALVDEELLDDVIDTSALSHPERAARFPDPLHAHVDVYWAERFAEAGRPYRSPAGVVGFATTIETGCGLADPNHETAFYCVLDETIYYSVEFRQIIEANIGDYGWVVVVAHEWAHHAQRLLGYDVAMLPYQAADVAPIALEQQADCLAGAYTEAAELSGWLHPGDVDEAITMTGLSGDPPGTTAHHPTAHGSGEERVAAFVRGYEQGIVGCDLGL